MQGKQNSFDILSVLRIDQALPNILSAAPLICTKFFCQGCGQMKKTFFSAWINLFVCLFYVNDFNDKYNVNDVVTVASSEMLELQ